MAPNLYSPDFFARKQQERIAKLTPDDFEPWEEARERYIETKIEPLLDKYRESDHDWFKEFSRRRGESMHSSELIYRLQKLNPHLQVQNQTNFPTDWGLYATVGGRVQFLTGFQKGWLTEWSYSIVDSRDLPLEERRGWRTVLIYLLLKGALEWDAVVCEFGEPQDSWNDYRWQAVTLDFRRGGNDQMVQRNISNLFSS